MSAKALSKMLMWIDDNRDWTDFAGLRVLAENAQLILRLPRGSQNGHGLISESGSGEAISSIKKGGKM